MMRATLAADGAVFSAPAPPRVATAASLSALHRWFEQAPKLGGQLAPSSIGSAAVATTGAALVIVHGANALPPAPDHLRTVMRRLATASVPAAETPAARLHGELLRTGRSHLVRVSTSLFDADQLRAAIHTLPQADAYRWAVTPVSIREHCIPALLVDTPAWRMILAETAPGPDAVALARVSDLDLWATGAADPAPADPFAGRGGR
jgi:hypothetical protein